MEVTGKNVPMPINGTWKYNEDPYWLDIVELTIRVADCFETHPQPVTHRQYRDGTRRNIHTHTLPEDLDYFYHWFGIAHLEAMFNAG